MYFNARYYSGALGRFVSADTVVPGAGNPQAFNRYSYGSNNPIRYSDPTGHCAGPGLLLCLFGLMLIGSAIPSDTCCHHNPNGLNNVALGLTFLSPVADAVVTFADCLANGCDPVTTMMSLSLPGPSPSTVSHMDDVDLPRMTNLQIEGVNSLARNSDCTIHICGGYAENTIGIENRAIAYKQDPGKAIGPVPLWRNRKGPPVGGDLDYWTPRGTDLSAEVKSRLLDLFPSANSIDNYNQKYPELLLPPGTVTFTGRDQPVRNTATWQRPYNWKEMKPE
jgi:hypothetical protein